MTSVMQMRNLLCDLMDIAARRKNVSIACDACRSRKRKCDGTLPICTACLGCEKQCTYSEDKRSSTKRRQYGGQRVQDLEDQVAGLMRYIDQLEGVKATTAAEAAPVTTTTRTDGTTTAQEFMKTIHKEFEDSQSEQELITPDHSLAVTDDLKRLPDALEDLSHMLCTLDVLDAGETHFKGPPGNFCFLATKAPPQLQHNIKQEIADVYVTYSLMSQHLREMLALFMKHVNPFYQFLDANGLSQVTIEPSVPLPSQLLYASVISAGALYASDPHALPWNVYHPLEAFGKVDSGNASARTRDTAPKNRNLLRAEVAAAFARQDLFAIMSQGA
ncbi:hypothetical protein KCU74_g7230, partial [Aureobasidium melanogenum]